MEPVNEKIWRKILGDTFLGKKKVKAKDGTVYYIPNADRFDIPRNEMPQIKPRYVQAYLSFLQKNNVKFETKSVYTKGLKPTQNEFNGDKIQTAERFRDLNTNYLTMISKDNYILDGHHRWLAEYNRDNNSMIKVIHINLSIKKLITLTKNFKHVTYKGLKG